MSGLAERTKNLSTKDQEFVTDEQYDKYLDGRVQDKSKFHYFFSASIQVLHR
jgi:hypothetical protein